MAFCLALDRRATELNIGVEGISDAELISTNTGKTFDAELASTKTGNALRTEKSSIEDGKILINYLYKDNKSNTSRVVNKEQNGAKRAELHYRLLSCTPVKDFFKKYDDTIYNNITSVKTEGGISLLADYENTDIALAQIKLITGRHHQIRVQMSNAGMSLLGDYKYADDKTTQLAKLIDQRQVSLCAYKLEFNHPVSGKKMTFHKNPEAGIFQIFSL